MRAAVGIDDEAGFDRGAGWTCYNTDATTTGAQESHVALIGIAMAIRAADLRGRERPLRVFRRGSPAGIFRFQEPPGPRGPQRAVGDQFKSGDNPQRNFGQFTPSMTGTQFSAA